MPLNFRNFANEVLTHCVITLAPYTKQLLIMMIFVSFQISMKIFKYGMSHNIETIKINVFCDGCNLQNMEISNNAFGNPHILMVITNIKSVDCNYFDIM